MSDTTDPRKLPSADPHTGNRRVDPITGYDTTGHDWGGITELNTAFPKIVIWALALTFLYSLVAWILLPAWPLGRDYTRGILGLDQGEQAIEGLRELTDDRLPWLSRFSDGDLRALQSDAVLIRQAMPAAERLFEDNCSACHGATGRGGPGFPVLADGYWLWGDDPGGIAETIRFGINSDHVDARIAEMPSFDWMARADRLALADYVARLPGAGPVHSSLPGAALFTENCAACHGDGGRGDLEAGAPSLTDDAVIYGQDRSTVMETLSRGRRGVMPAWIDRLSAAEINLLAIYVYRLGQPVGEGAQ